MATDESKGVEADCHVGSAGRKRRLHGLVIGNGTYTDGSDQLPLSVGDAEAMQTCLVQDLRADPSDVTCLTDSGVATAWVQFNNMLNDLEKGSVCVLYFSGHGSQDSGDVIMYFVDGTRLSASCCVGQVALRVETDSLTDVVLLLMLDCCREESQQSASRAMQRRQHTGVAIVAACAPGLYLPRRRGTLTGLCVHARLLARAPRHIPFPKEADPEHPAHGDMGRRDGQPQP